MSETISPKTTIAQYSIVSKIGEGGMGEVWRARDPRLGRDVAIKILPADFAKHTDRLNRFEQEARATSALNHPNILTVYDIGEHQGSPYIVSELLDGEELRDRLNHGSLSLRKAIDYAQQIANRLCAAHEKGIVHRDLKPENLFTTRDERIKILDFGIAKLTTPPQSNPDISEDATRKVLTNPGMVIGTVGYMSPEQVRGQTADHRSDIFSFGAILHEMITGRRAFKRETMAETMTAILKEEPEELSASNPNISPALERIVNRCLEKKPERRFQSTADLGFALDALSAPTSSSGRDLTAAANVAVAETKKSTWRARIPWITAVLFTLLAATGFGLWRLDRTSASERAIYLAFSPPPSLAFNDKQYDYAVISPDGQKVAFTAFSPEGKSTVYVADLNSPEAKPLPGTFDALEPFWSPDSKSVAFGSQGKLKRVDVAGGNSKVICDAARMTGGAWSKTGVIVFGPDYGQLLFKVSANGGEPEQVTFKDDGEGGGGHRFPNFLPDGKHFVFSGGGKGIRAGSLDSRDVTQVSPENSVGIYANGRLIYVRNQVLVAQEFDADSLRLSGEAAPIATGAVVNATGQVRLSVSATGVLLFQGNWERQYQMVWYDREGKQVGAIGKPELRRTGEEPNISPDGKRLAVKRDGIWTSDLNGENAIKLGGSQFPVWSPDGSRVALNLNLQGKHGIYERAANGVGEPVLLLEGTVFAQAASSDGRFLLYMYRGVKTRADVWVLPRFGDGKPFPILATAADELQPKLSPDGKWLAYSSDESNNYEVYVQSFTAEGKLGSDRKRISSGGGIVPNWSSDGKELFYVDGDGQMIAVAVNTSGAAFQSGSPTALFKTRMFDDASVFHEFAVSHDGQRFLVGTLIGDSKSPRPTVILNWPAALKKQ